MTKINLFKDTAKISGKDNLVETGTKPLVEQAFRKYCKLVYTVLRGPSTNYRKYRI